MKVECNVVPYHLFPAWAGVILRCISALYCRPAFPRMGGGDPREHSRRAPWSVPEKADMQKVWYNKITQGGRKMGRKSEYSREEKIAAVKLVTEGGRDVPSVANEYGIHENTLWKWKRQYTINPEAAFHGEPILTAQEAQERELQQLRRRIRELEQENDFLKKVSAYFAKNPR